MHRLLWRPLFIIYETLAGAMAEARADPSAARRGATYSDALIPVLALAATARVVIGLAAALWFAGVFVVAEATQSVLDPWVDVVGLSLGWTAALGMFASLVRMGIAWMPATARTSSFGSGSSSRAGGTWPGKRSSPRAPRSGRWPEQAREQHVLLRLRLRQDPSGRSGSKGGPPLQNA